MSLFPLHVSSYVRNSARLMSRTHSMLVSEVQPELFGALFPSPAPIQMGVETVGLRSLAAVNIIVPTLLAACSGPVLNSATLGVLRRASRHKSLAQWVEEVCDELSAGRRLSIAALVRGLGTLQGMPAAVPPNDLPSSSLELEVALDMIRERLGFEGGGRYVRAEVGGEGMLVTAGQCSSFSDADGSEGQRGFLFGLCGAELVALDVVLSDHVLGRPLQLAVPVGEDHVGRAAIPCHMVFPRGARDVVGVSPPLPHDALVASALHALCEMGPIRRATSSVFDALAFESVDEQQAPQDTMFLPKHAFKSFLQAVIIEILWDRVTGYLGSVPGPSLPHDAEQRLRGLFQATCARVVAAELASTHLVRVAVREPVSLGDTNERIEAVPSQRRGVAPTLELRTQPNATKRAPQLCVGQRDFHRLLVRVLLFASLVMPSIPGGAFELPPDAQASLLELFHSCVYRLAGVKRTPVAHTVDAIVSKQGPGLPVLSRGVASGADMGAPDVLDVKAESDFDSSPNVVVAVTSGSTVGFDARKAAPAALGTGRVKQQVCSKQESASRRARLHLLDSYPLQKSLQGGL